MIIYGAPTTGKSGLKSRIETASSIRGALYNIIDKDEFTHAVNSKCWDVRESLMAQDKLPKFNRWLESVERMLERLYPSLQGNYSHLLTHSEKAPYQVGFIRSLDDTLFYHDKRREDAHKDKLNDKEINFIKQWNNIDGHNLSSYVSKHPNLIVIPRDVFLSDFFAIGIDGSLLFTLHYVKEKLEKVSTELGYSDLREYLKLISGTRVYSRLLKFYDVKLSSHFVSVNSFTKLMGNQSDKRILTDADKLQIRDGLAESQRLARVEIARLEADAKAVTTKILGKPRQPRPFLEADLKNFDNNFTEDEINRLKVLSQS